MKNDIRNKTNSQNKQERLNKVIALINKFPNLRSANAIKEKYETEYHENLDRSTLSRYLSNAPFEKRDGYYRVILEEQLLKKEQLLSTLLNEAEATLITNYDLLFISLNKDFSSTIAHYLEDHTTLQPFILGIIPCTHSLMIFCKQGYKQTLHDTINALLSS